MEKVYILTVTEKELKAASDMLRYDSAYAVHKVADQGYYIYALGFTEARWGSFGVLPRVHSRTVTARELRGLYEKATGFLEGLRLAQELFGQRIVEGSC